MQDEYTNMFSGIRCLMAFKQTPLANHASCFYFNIFRRRAINVKPNIVQKMTKTSILFDKRVLRYILYW